jgi:hypothetical protein
MKTKRFSHEAAAHTIGGMFCHRHLHGAALAVTLVLKPAPALHLGVDIAALSTMPPRQIQTMVREATAIWEPYGVALGWIRWSEKDLGLPAAPDVLTIIRDDAPDQGATATFGNQPLGTVWFLEGRGTAENTMTLSIDAIRRTVEGAQWASRRVADWPPAVRDELLGRAFGRVVAHEIGHYLLVWRAHTRDGLMRAAFPGGILIQPERGPFALSDRLVPRLRARLARLTTPGSSLAGTR